MTVAGLDRLFDSSSRDRRRRPSLLNTQTDGFAALSARIIQFFLSFSQRVQFNLSGASIVHQLTPPPLENESLRLRHTASIRNILRADTRFWAEKTSSQPLYANYFMATKPLLGFYPNKSADSDGTVFAMSELFRSVFVSTELTTLAAQFKATLRGAHNRIESMLHIKHRRNPENPGIFTTSTTPPDLGHNIKRAPDAYQAT